MDNLSINERFAEARLRVLGDKAFSSGIGTYSEKSLHKILKNTIEPDEAKQEIPYLGYVADIKNEEGITEIQTKAFSNLRPKLKAFLEESRVTVVYPLHKNKIVRNINADSGEISQPRLSPKHQSVCDAAYELYNIREFIGNKNLCVKLIFLSVEEYRRQGVRTKVAGRTRSTERLECIPIKIEEIVELSSPMDYKVFLPSGICESFCVSDINKAYGAKFKRGFSIVKLLESAGILTEGERVGKKITYSLKF